MDNFDFLDIIKKADPEYNEAIVSSPAGYINTGSYIFNAVLSGSIYGGIPDNRVTALAGEEATAKTFFAMSLVKQFLDDNPEARAVYFDTEFALDQTFFHKRGIDTSRVYLLQPNSLESFRTTALKILTEYEKLDPRPKLMLVLDSLSNLPSEKEATDAASGNNVRDMTKQQVIKSIFRVLTQKMGRLHVPMICVSHVYQVVGSYVPTKAMSGGSGLKYAASSILFLSKKKDKDGNDVVGNFIRIKTDKSRFSKESKVVETKLDFSKGIDKHHGLLELAEKYEIVKRVGNRYEFPSGVKVFGKHLEESPETYWTEDILALLDEAAKKEFSLGEISLEEEKETIQE